MEIKRVKTEWRSGGCTGDQEVKRIEVSPDLLISCYPSS
jgi:hypothetical protein